MTTTVTTAARSRTGFIGLLTADGISMLGTRMSMLAIPWFVLITTGSATKTGFAAFCELAPFVVVQAVGGPIVDRWGPRRIAISTDLIAGLVLATVPILYAKDVLTFPMLLAALAVSGAVRGAGDSARVVLLPGVQEPAQISLERATGIYDGVNRTTSMIGAPLAGFLIAMLSAPWVIAIDALTFVVSGSLVALLIPRSADPIRDAHAHLEGEPDASYMEQLRVGLRFIRADRLLMGIAVMVFVTNLLDMGMSSVLLPVWIEDEIGDPLALGLVAAALGLGAVLGNTAAAWVGERLPRRRTYGWGFIIGGAPRFLILAVAMTLSPVLAVSFVSGLAVGVINPILGAVEYERVPRTMQARVLGTLGAVAWAGMPLGGLLAGAMVTGFGLTQTLLVMGGVYFVTTMAPFVFPCWRAMDRGQTELPVT
ncbi:MAG TPA: MFS transporter [Actinomycetes bacterium]|nr:MFS transporter [Actinomycetes bacterium]